MNPETKGKVFKRYFEIVDEEIKKLKERISEELKKIDDEASSRQGKSDVGDVGGMCSCQNITRGVIKCLNEQIESLLSLKQELSNGFETQNDSVGNWTIVSVSYQINGKDDEKAFFIVPALPGKIVYEDGKYSICTLSFDTPLAKSLIGNKKGDLISSFFNLTENDGKIIEIF